MPQPWIERRILFAANTNRNPRGEAMSELGVIKLSNGQRLFVEVEDLRPEEAQRLAGDRNRAPDDVRPSDLPPGAEPTGIREDMVDALAQLRENIQVMAGEIYEALKDHKPQQWSLEFSIGFKGKANPIPFIVQGEANSALKVTATWTEQN